MIRGVLGIVCCLALSGLSSAYLHHHAGEIMPRSASGDVLTRLLGSSKEMIGDRLYLEADLYYHGGAYLRPGSRGHRECLLEKMEAHEAGAPGEKELEAHAEPGASPSANWIRRIDERIRIYEHRHLEGIDQEVEILPFLAFATELDPHHEEAVLTTAYWLSDRLGKVDEALRVLVDGIARNPSSWRIPFELGMLYLDHKHDDARALEALSLTVRNARGAHLEEADVKVLRAAHYYSGLIHERMGARQDARADYESALALFAPGAGVPFKNTVEKKLLRLNLRD